MQDLTRKNIITPCVFFLIYSILQCHTVTYEHKLGSLTYQNEATVGSLGISLSKRQAVDNVNQIQNLSISDNKTASVEFLSNRTVLQTKPPIISGEVNITQSLPAWMSTIKSGALQRTGFVALGFMSIIVIFFVVRGVRLRHKKSKSRKYGIITSTDMEMEPLDKDDDDEEETTLFDAQHKYSLQ